MELWEFVCCVKAYNRKQDIEAKDRLAIAWQTAAFVGAAFAGKLKSLKSYIKEIDNNGTKDTAPVVSREEFESKLAEAERRLNDA